MLQRTFPAKYLSPSKPDAGTDEARKRKHTADTSAKEESSLSNTNTEDGSGFGLAWQIDGGEGILPSETIALGDLKRGGLSGLDIPSR